MNAFAERIGRYLADRMNALVVKEVRQAIRGRSFTTWFLLLSLYAAAAAIIVASIHASDFDIGPLGGGLFVAYLGALLFIIWGVVPLNTYFGLAQEIDDRTIELVAITRLSAAGIVRGKILAALIQSGLYTCLLLPFLTFSFLLRGIDILTILVLVVSALLFSIGYSILAVFLAAIVPNRIVRLLGGAVFAMGLMTSVFLATGMAFAMIQFQAIDNLNFGGLSSNDLLAIGGSILLLASLGVLIFQLAVGRLSFHTADRSTGPRATLVVQWLLVTIVTILIYDGDLLRPAVPFAYGVFAVLQAYLLFVLGGADSEEVSRRTLRRVASAPIWSRLPQRLLMPGGRMAIALALVLGGVATLLACALLIVPDWFVATPASHSVSDRAIYRASTLCLLWAYVVIYAGIPMGVARLVNPFISPRALRAFTLAAIPTGLLLSGVSRLVAPAWLLPYANGLVPIEWMRRMRWNQDMLGSPTGQGSFVGLGAVAVAAVVFVLYASRRAEVRRRRMILESLHG